MDEIVNQKTGCLKKVIEYNCKNIVGNLPPKLIEQKKKEEDLKSMNKVEKFKVQKFVGGMGIKKSVQIDTQKNEQTMAKIQEIMKKERCIDIFRDAFVKNEKEANDMLRIQRATIYKFRIRSLQQQFDKIKMLLQMRIIKGSMYLMLILKKIETSKQIFMLEIQSGKDVFVPQDLSQSQLPLSFRYYDPILLLIKNRMPHENNEIFGLQKAMDFHHNQESLSALMLQKVGINVNLYSDDQGKKLTYQHGIVNTQREIEINHYGSPHVSQLQRSDYLSIDINPDINKLTEAPQHQMSKTGSRATVAGQVDIIKICKDLNIKYLKKE